MTSTTDIKSLKFPSDFYWGYATASAQVEGSIDVHGKGLSIWDTFSADPSHSEDGGSTKVATDFFNKYQEDIDLMKSYGVNAHRMSLSWSRIIPQGGKGDPINKEGVQFYRKLLKALLDAGITPFVTLFHWDLPQDLQDKYLGFLSKEIVADFENYARICFESFGDLVKHWFTINEPNIYSLLGHCFGKHAPGRSSDRQISPEGDSYTEPFIVGHNLLLAHATSVKLYRDEFAEQGGKIGLVINMNWGEPIDTSPENVFLAKQFMACTAGWFAEPITTGDYPQLMKDLKGHRLPSFTEEEKSLLKGSTDFLAINHYTTYMIKKRTTAADPADMWTSFLPDIEPGFQDADGKDIGPLAGLSWVRPVPWGFGKLMQWAYDSYKVDIYISENGVVCPNENELPREQAINDDFRIGYLESYADQIALKIAEGIPIKSYLMWAWTVCAAEIRTR
ncbi:hypothetical protein QFC22_006701 [Naganishia vaughanmartiniae]|uniref:Uncharacterized protein n=1 Tax=Naganishia vaughanmartiniae TaxID=1424756 RepID=A0ACC2WG16_9TREE|nr:hypothetical protein QFC22_006701 [Naganishia vaughanmartiniae]